MRACFNSTFPSEIPTPNTIIVPQGIVFSTPFHVITPTLGVNIIAKAIKVMDAESIGCRIFSVDQKKSNTDIIIRRHSLKETGLIYLILL